jgi:hypothetical protein
VEHAIPRYLVDELGHRAGLADAHREAEKEFVINVARAQEPVGEGLPSEIEELMDKTTTHTTHWSSFALAGHVIDAGG